jgi:hypothetical protein
MNEKNNVNATTTNVTTIALRTMRMGGAMESNEKEISHGRVSWQTHCGWLALGLLASSIG